MTASYEIKLAAFEGPLDLLIHLIDKNEIDIYDIPIAVITEQYMEYLEEPQEFQIEIATEFIVMAATLLYIKSRMLLPKQAKEQTEPESDPRQELVERLLEYRRYKEVSQVLEDMAKEQAQLFSRRPTELAGKYQPLEVLNIDVLLKAFQDVMASKEQEQALVSRETCSVPDKMNELVVLLAARPQGILFSEAFSASSARLEIITTFMAVLELIKLGRLEVRQTEIFAPIYLKLAEGDEKLS